VFYLTRLFDLQSLLLLRRIRVRRVFPSIVFGSKDHLQMGLHRFRLLMREYLLNIHE